MRGRPNCESSLQPCALPPYRFLSRMPRPGLPRAGDLNRPRSGEGNMIESMATTWETIEERERRVRGTRTTSTMVRAAEQIPAGKDLKTAFAQRPFISRQE